MPNKTLSKHHASDTGSHSTITAYSTIAAWAIAISWALKAQGLNADEIFATAGLTLSDFEQKPSSRIPIEHMTQLWEASITATSNPAFGLSVTEHVHAVHLKALGMLIVSCESLAQALDKIVSYHALVSDSVQLDLHHSADKVGFSIRAVEGVNISPAAYDAFFSVIVKFCRNMMGNDELVARLDLIRHKPNSLKPWLKFFGREVYFNQDDNCLWLYRSFLEKNSLHFDEKVQQMNENAVQDYLQDMNANTWVDKCRKHLIIGLNEEAPSLTKVAGKLNVSERTLARHLRAEGVSFSEILQQKKQDLACYYLLETDENITGVALNLGFQDVSNFNRAFQRWYNMTPSDFRNKRIK
ncbi:MAG: AraC family transcriptional regulator [Oleispira antarctica]|nr:AraC family transcriptional regulator [Oleispira antarctica]MBQ0793586.1 AraC family transcriptional regulator [Oleispira antarctica]